MRVTGLLFITTIVYHKVWSMFIHNGAPLNEQGLESIEINLDEYIQIGDTFTTINGDTKYRAQQQYKGVDIFGANLVIGYDTENTLLSSQLSGTYYQTNVISSDFNDDVEPLITSDNALKIAIQYYIPNGDETDLFGYSYGESKLTTKNSLSIYHNDDKNIPFTLSYIIQFTYEDTESQEVLRPFVVVDAKTGDILYTFASMVGQTGTECPNDEAWATGGNEKIGEQRHGPMCINESPIVINDDVEVYDHVSMLVQEVATCTQEVGSAFCEVNDYFINGAYNCLGDGYKYGNIVFDLYSAWGPEGVGPLAPENMPLEFYLHYGTNFENAFWTGRAMYFGDGLNRFYPLISLDVAAHEVAHGFTEQGSNLIYSDQSGGINEAYSDLAGEAAEEFYRGECDWLCGYDINKPTPENPDSTNCAQAQWEGKCALRYLMDPPRDGNSIGNSDDFVPGMNVHYSSGVYNKAWYRLQKGRGWTMQEIFTTISHTNYYYWGRNTNYIEGLCAILPAIEDLFPSSLVNLKWTDVQWAFGDAPLETNPDVGPIGGPNVFCPTSANIKSAQAEDDEDTQNDVRNNNDHKMYYIYGGIGAGCFALIAILLIVYFYRRRARKLRQQLNGALADENFYGAVVTDDERE